MAVSTSSAALFQPDSQLRAMLACVGVSIALHAMVLLLFPGMRANAPASSGPKILTATLAPRVALPEPAPAIEPPAPRAVEPPPLPPKPKAEPKPEPRPVLTRPSPSAQQQATPAPAPAPSAPAQTASVPPSPPPVAAPSAAEAQTPPFVSGDSAAKPSAEIADAGTLDQYRIALIGAAKRYKRYPAQAMEKGWQGKVEIRLVIGTNGMIQNVLIKTSSGYQILDDQAMDMVKKAKPLTQIPSALRGREFTVDIPVIFDLQTG